MQMKHQKSTPCRKGSKRPSLGQLPLPSVFAARTPKPSVWGRRCPHPAGLPSLHTRGGKWTSSLRISKHNCRKAGDMGCHLGKWQERHLPSCSFRPTDSFRTPFLRPHTGAGGVCGQQSRTFFSLCSDPRGRPAHSCVCFRHRSPRPLIPYSPWPSHCGVLRAPPLCPRPRLTSSRWTARARCRRGRGAQGTGFQLKLQNRKPFSVSLTPSPALAFAFDAASSGPVLGSGEGQGNEQQVSTSPPTPSA